MGWDLPWKKTKGKIKKKISSHERGRFPRQQATLISAHFLKCSPHLPPDFSDLQSELPVSRCSLRKRESFGWSGMSHPGTALPSFCWRPPVPTHCRSTFTATNRTKAKGHRFIPNFPVPLWPFSIPVRLNRLFLLRSSRALHPPHADKSPQRTTVVSVSEERPWPKKTHHILSYTRISACEAVWKTNTPARNGLSLFCFVEFDVTHARKKASQGTIWRTGPAG